MPDLVRENEELRRRCTQLQVLVSELEQQKRSLRERLTVEQARRQALQGQLAYHREPTIVAQKVDQLERALRKAVQR